MKKIGYLLVLIGLFGCKSKTTYNQTLTDTDWKNIIYFTFATSDIRKPYIYYEFNNTGLKDILSSTYINCEFIGYNVNDSIIKFINSRQNKPILYHLDTIYNIKFINDTVFQKFFLTYSEPLYIDTNLICVAISQKRLVKSIETQNQKVFFFKKVKAKSLKLMGYYDVKKDMYYQAKYLSN